MNPKTELALVGIMWLVFLFFGWYGGFEDIKWFAVILLAATIAILIRNYYLSKK